MKNSIEDKGNTVPWWQPGLVLFMRLSAWIAVPVIGAIFAGKYLDRLFHTQPWLFLISVAISFIVSMVMIVRIGLKEMTASAEAEETKNKKQ